MRLPKWNAIYNDGQYIEETDTFVFTHIDKSRLGQFVLVCSLSCELKLDCESGELFVNSKLVRQPVLQQLQHRALSYGNNIIQFKKAYEIIATGGTSGQIIESGNIGYKVTVDDVLYSVVLSHHIPTSTTMLEIKMTDLKHQRIIKTIKERVVI